MPAPLRALLHFGVDGKIRLRDPYKQLFRHTVDVLYYSFVSTMCLSVPHAAVAAWLTTLSWVWTDTASTVYAPFYGGMTAVPPSYATTGDIMEFSFDVRGPCNTPLHLAGLRRWSVMSCRGLYKSN